MGDKFSKSISVNFSIKSIVNGNGKDFSNELSDDQVKELMEVATNESLELAIEHSYGELIFKILINDCYYNVSGWFKKQTSLK